MIIPIFHKSIDFYNKCIMDSILFDAFHKLQLDTEKFDITHSLQNCSIHLEELRQFEFHTFSFTGVIPEFQRITINKNLQGNTNSTINFLKYSPESSVSKYGRANLIEQSMLYATFML